MVRDRLEKEYGARTAEVAEYVANTMAQEKSSGSAVTGFGIECNDGIRKLIAAGFIIRSDNDLSVAFRHQTMFDFLRARAFVRKNAHLSDYVINEKRQSLFVRPILWSSLHYLRGSDRAVYRREFQKLWSARNLRSHVRRLL